ncbi:MAG: hypothetical protein FJ020_07495 [Chloroflexi bacterium]|nr:hypothetical protein [Chloroflexota bacterium]
MNHHSIHLTGLKSGTTHRCRVMSGDGSGDKTVSADRTFTAAGESAATPAWARISMGLAVGAGVLAGAAYAVSIRAARLKKFRSR